MDTSHIRSPDIHQERQFPFDKLFLGMLFEVLVTPFAAYKQDVRSAASRVVSQRLSDAAEK